MSEQKRRGLPGQARPRGRYFRLPRGHPDSGRFDLGGAEFVLGYLPEGVELRIGQDIGSGL